MSLHETAVSNALHLHEKDASMRESGRLEKAESVSVESDPMAQRMASESPESRGTRSDSELSLVTKRGDTTFDDFVHCEDATTNFLCHGEGYLRKENRRGRFQRRYFATNNAYLNYYSQKSTYISGDRSLASASIDLRLADTICILSRNGKPTRKFAIQTQQGKGLQEECFFLKARTLEDAVRWVQILQRRRDYWLSQSHSKTRARVKGGLGLPVAQDSSKKYLEMDAAKAAPGDEAPWWKECCERTGSSASEDSSEEIDSGDDGFITGQDDDEDEGDSSVEQKDDVGAVPSSELASFKSVPCAHKALHRIRNVPRSPCASMYWVEPDVRKLRIRGKSYMVDGEKVEATEPMFKLFAIDIFKTNGRVDHIVAHPQHRIGQAIKRKEKLPFMFIVNLQIPGPPFYSYVVCFIATKKTTEAVFKKKDVADLPPSFPQLADRFFRGEDDVLRDCRFKLCPRIVEGPFVVRHGIPNKPAILGKKLTQRYFRGENYLELCIDIGSSVVAWKLTQMSLSLSKLITVDLAFVLQGNCEEELPEQVIGIMRAIKPDFSKAIPLE